MPKFRGSGGAVFDIDPPAEGTQAREHFDGKLASGALVLVEERAPKAKPEPKG